MGLNDNLYDMPQDIQRSELESQRRKHGKDLAIKTLDAFSRNGVKQLQSRQFDVTQMRYILQAAAASGMDTKRVEQLEQQLREHQQALLDLNKMLTDRARQNDDLCDKLQQTEALVAKSQDQGRAAIQQLNQVTEQAMQLREDKKHLMRVLEMYVSKM